MNTDNKELLKRIQSDLEESKILQSQQIDYVSKMRAIYKGETLPNNKNGSNFIAKEVFKQIEWIKAQYKHPFVSNDTIVRLTATSQDNINFSKQSETLLNYFYIKKFDRYNFINDALHTLHVEGTLIVRTGWEYKGEEVLEHEVYERPIPLSALDPNQTEDTNIIQQQVITTKKEIPIINKPTATVVKLEDIFIDPTATNQDEIQYIIHRKATRLHELEEAGIYTNLDKLKSHLIKEASNTDTSKDLFVEPYSTETNINLTWNLDDINRKKFYMYEYWGYQEIDGEIKPIVCTYVDDIIIRLEENPYPDKKIPYIVMQCIREPYSLYGKSLVELIEEHQRIKTGIMRSMFDSLAQSVNGQKGVKKGNLDSVNFKRFMNGQTFEYNMSPNDFYIGQYNRIPAEIFQLIKDVDYDKQVLSGVIPMQGGQGVQAIYGSQAAKSGAMSSLMLKELDTVNNIAQNLIKPMLNKWLIYIYDLLDPEEIQEITHMQYIPKDKYEILGFNDNFTIDISTQQTDEIKASELAFLMQTLGQSLPFDMTKLLMSEIAKLKKMPNLAEQIQQYEPQPDPVQQQLQQLQLQKAQLELQILQGQAQADIQLKTAKAKEAEAKATNTNTGTIKQKYGIDYQQKLKELELKHQLDLQKLQEQARLKQQEQLPSNVGISSPKQQPYNNMFDSGSNQTL